MTISEVKLELSMKPVEQSLPEKIRTEIYKNMTPLQKWEEVYRLRVMAWELKSAGLKAKYPEWSEEEIRREVRRIFLYAVT